MFHTISAVRVTTMSPVYYRLSAAHVQSRGQENVGPNIIAKLFSK